MIAGMGRAEITPPLGVELAGYGYYLGRRARSVMDPLWARALYLKDGDRQVMLIDCDLLGLSREVTEEVRRGLKSMGFNGEMVLVSIHTHTGPAIKYHEGCGYTDAAYTATLAPRILKACRSALEDASEVESLTGTFGELPPGLIWNRSSEDGPVDLGVRGIKIRRLDGRSLALVSAACHPVCNGRIDAISADYPGEVVRLLGEEGFDGMYLNGLCGDIDPNVQGEDDRPAFRSRLAQAVVHAWGENEKPLPCRMRAGSFVTRLKLQPVTKDEIRASAQRAEAGAADEGAARVARIWAEEMLERFDTLSFSEEIRISWVLLGGRLILALPFEGFTATGEIIREMTGMRDAMILGCAEELLGYLPSVDDIERGAYAALESTYLYKSLPVLPGEAERLGRTAAEQIGAILKDLDG